MDRATFRQKCRNREMCWGTMLLEHMSPATVRTMARAGYDWLWLDDEHSPYAYNVLRDCIRTADDIGIVPIVRVAQLDYARIAQALDCGAGGIIVPRLETPEQARHAVDYAKYPPIGRRGFGMRSQVFGKHRMSMHERIDDQQARVLCIQIESRLGAQNIEAMLDAGDGQIDFVIFGPADFQMDIGRPDHPDDPELDAAARHVSAVCAQRGVGNGLPVTSMNDAQTWLDRGYTIMTYLNDDAFMSDYAEKCRGELKLLRPGA